MVTAGSSTAGSPDASLSAISPPQRPAGDPGRLPVRLSRRRGSDAILGVAKGNCARDCQGVTSRTAVRLTFRQRRPGCGFPAWDARKPLSPTPGPAGSAAWLWCDSGRCKGQLCQGLSGIDMPRSAPAPSACAVCCPGKIAARAVPASAAPQGIPRSAATWDLFASHLATVIRDSPLSPCALHHTTRGWCRPDRPALPRRKDRRFSGRTVDTRCWAWYRLGVAELRLDNRHDHLE
jgi:hypothetical protein